MQLPLLMDAQGAEGEDETERIERKELRTARINYDAKKEGREKGVSFPLSFSLSTLYLQLSILQQSMSLCVCE